MTQETLNKANTISDNIAALEQICNALTNGKPGGKYIYIPGDTNIQFGFLELTKVLKADYLQELEDL